VWRACDCPRAAAPAGLGRARGFAGSAAQHKILGTRPPPSMSARSRDLPNALSVGAGRGATRRARHQRRIDVTVIAGGIAIAAPSSSTSSVLLPRPLRILRRRSERERV